MERPRLLWIALGNYDWGGATLEGDPQEVRRARAQQDSVMSFVDRAVQLQKGLGGQTVLEGSPTSECWDHRFAARWTSSGDYVDFLSDMSCFREGPVPQRGLPRAD